MLELATLGAKVLHNRSVELAKKYGVETAEPIWQAKRKCPDLLLVKPHYNKYKEYSEKIT